MTHDFTGMYISDKKLQKAKKQAKRRALLAAIDYDEETPRCANCAHTGHAEGNRLITACKKHNFQNSGGGLCRDWTDKHTGAVLEEA